VICTTRIAALILAGLSTAIVYQTVGSKWIDAKGAHGARWISDDHQQRDH
jgi:hypothetical protein